MILKNEIITKTNSLEKEESIQTTNLSNKNKSSFKEELKNLKNSKNKIQEKNKTEGKNEIEELFESENLGNTEQKETLSDLILYFTYQQKNFLPLQANDEKTINHKVFIPENTLSEPIDVEPTVNFNKEKLKVSIEFPDSKASADLKTVNIEYDPISRSITAEMITAPEAVRILQAQIAELEKSLAKHNLKLKSIKISSSQGSQEKQQKNKQKKQNMN